MRLAATLLLLATACAPSSHTAVPVSGKARTTTMVTTSTTTTTAPATTTAPPTTTVAPTTTTAPEPEVLAAAAPPRTSGPCGGWRDLIAVYFPASQVDKACAVMLCESNGNPNAVSHTDDHGLFQINRRWNPTAPWDRIYDPTANTAYAAQLWQQRGWTAWACA